MLQSLRFFSIVVVGWLVLCLCSMCHLFDQKWHFYKCWNELGSVFVLFSNAFNSVIFYSRYCCCCYHGWYYHCYCVAVSRFAWYNQCKQCSENTKTEQKKMHHQTDTQTYTVQRAFSIWTRLLVLLSIDIWQSKSLSLHFSRNIRFNRKLSGFYVVSFRFLVFSIPFHASFA